MTETVPVMPRPEKENMSRIPIHVELSTSKGGTLINIRPTETVLFLKYMVYDVHDEDRDILFGRVFYKCKELYENQTLLECGITQPNEYLILVPLPPKQ